MAKNIPHCSCTYVILVFCFMYLPIAVMIVFSFNESKSCSNLRAHPLAVQSLSPCQRDDFVALGSESSRAGAGVSAGYQSTKARWRPWHQLDVPQKPCPIINNISYVPVVNRWRSSMVSR